MVYTILLDGKEISYNLLRKKVKNINVRIKPDGTVNVSANNFVPHKSIEQFLLSKSAFISGALKHYEEIRNSAPKPRQYVDGERFSICGRELILKVCHGAKNHVATDGGNIILTVTDKDDIRQKERVMDKWLKEQCISVITSVCETVYPMFREYGIKFPVLKFRRMTSRWGSCHSQKGILTFNIALAETPMECIEYVVVHEFTHFIEPNHSKRFYNQMSVFMPDWAERKRLLKHVDLTRAWG